ncbi:octanoate-[acyl-carrier-protein]-protein-N-octanoyltransferase [Candidatus Symbiothrix dinenymphae]|nr:octanoate-[acyl-carrier-protein]-protein-N-octanoyltransferase [Candidatus Symbiothrix dinenymphae]
MNFTDWGVIPYAQALERQQVLFDAVLQAKEKHEPSVNHVILCEHPPVFTLGKHGQQSNMLVSEVTLKARGIDVFPIDRGGDITYHGHGQLVVYPIIDLEAFHIGLKAYIHRLEEVIICVIAEYAIRGERLEGATGVWLDNDDPHKARKIAAIGVRSSRYVTMHGLALNVNTDLSYFNMINPCGFVDKGVTSMQQELRREVDMEALKRRFQAIFEAAFSQ